MGAFPWAVCAADVGVYVCPLCGFRASAKVDWQSTFTEQVFYYCTNDGCSYHKKVERIKNTGIELSVEGYSNSPSIVDGNAYWSVKADQVDKNPYYNEQQPTEAVIGPRGYKRYYLKMEPYYSGPPGTLVVSADQSFLTNYRLASTTGSVSTAWRVNWYYGGSTSQYLYYRPTSWSLPVSGTYEYGTNVEVLSGFVREAWYDTYPALGAGTILDYYTKSYVTGLAGKSISSGTGDKITFYGAENKQLGGYYGSFVKVRYFAELIADEYGVSVDYSVTNNNYINIENKTITVNNQEINYNNAYTYENNYYVYNSNDIPTVYITDDSGSIIGSCVYDAATSSYQIVLYGDYTEDDLGATATPAPTATPSPAPTASPAPTDAPSATDAPDNGGSGGDNSGSNGSNGGDNSGSSGGGFLDKLLQDLWDRLFGGLIDGLVAILDGILQILLKLLGSIFSVLPLFAALLGLVFPFVPSAILGIVSTGLFLAVILGVVKFIRGFF